MAFLSSQLAQLSTSVDLFRPPPPLRRIYPGFSFSSCAWCTICTDGTHPFQHIHNCNAFALPCSSLGIRELPFFFFFFCYDSGKTHVRLSMHSALPTSRSRPAYPHHVFLQAPARSTLVYPATSSISSSSCPLILTVVFLLPSCLAWSSFIKSSTSHLEQKCMHAVIDTNCTRPQPTAGLVLTHLLCYVLFLTFLFTFSHLSAVTLRGLLS